MQVTKCFIMIYVFLFHISMSLLHAVDCGFESRSGQTKDYEIGTCYFSAKHASLRRKSNDWLVRNLDKVSSLGRHVYPRTVDSVS
jgi:hypothetical protein